MPNTSEAQVPKNEIDDINMWLYVKDKFNISNEAWTELSMKSDDQPCLYKIIKHMHKLNQKWKLKPNPEEIEGVQVSFKDTLIGHVKRLKTSGILKEGETIKIKFSGDGTNIGKRLKVVNITFTILNEKKTCDE